VFTAEDKPVLGGHVSPTDRLLPVKTEKRRPGTALQAKVNDTPWVKNTGYLVFDRDTQADVDKMVEEMGFG